MSLTPMSNLKALRNELREKGYHITAFNFAYNGYEYIVLVENADNIACKSHYTIVILTFIDKYDENRTLTVEANSSKLEISFTQLVNYFHIATYHNGMRDIFVDFYSYFGTQIPNTITPIKDPQIKQNIVKRINKRDSSSSGTNCFKVHRNGIKNDKQMKRSIFNSEKARILRPSLFEKLKNDDTISFDFSETKPDLPDPIILKNFADVEATRHVERHLY